MSLNHDLDFIEFFLLYLNKYFFYINWINFVIIIIDEHWKKFDLFYEFI